MILTIVCYFPIFNAGFVNWDDDYFVTNNPLIQSFSYQNIKAWFSQPFLGLYQPFVLLSFAIDYKIDGLNPLVFHSTNLILHLINTVLVYWFVKKLFSNNTMAIITMLLFGLHSIHVESVAWVTERKDLLYSMFYLMTLNFYLEYISKQKFQVYLIVVLAFLFSLFSKAMAVSLPFILLLIDFHKERNLFSKKVLLEKVPFFLIAAVWGILTLYWHGQHGSMANATGFQFVERVLLAFKGLAFYGFHILIPINLAAFHPLPESFSTTILFECIFYILIFITITSWLFLKRKKYRVFFFGFGLFILSLFLFLIPPGAPVIASERYAYISSIGIFILLSYGYVFFIDKLKKYKLSIQILLAGYLLFLGMNTFQMTKTWQNSLALWNNVINVHGEIFYPLQQRGIAYRLDQNYPAAINDFNRVVELIPKHQRAYEQRGYVYSLMGEYENAKKDFVKATELNPNSHIAWSNLGFIYRKVKDHIKALGCLDKAINIKNDYVDAYINRAKVYETLEEYDKACNDLSTAKSKFPTKKQIEEITILQIEIKCKEEIVIRNFNRPDCDALPHNTAQWLAMTETRNQKPMPKASL